MSIVMLGNMPTVFEILHAFVHTGSASLIAYGPALIRQGRNLRSA